MKKKIPAILVVLFLLLSGMPYGAGDLSASCCAFNLDCCCEDREDRMEYLLDYMCVCSGGRLLLNRCVYLAGYNYPDDIN